MSASLNEDEVADLEWLYESSGRRNSRWWFWWRSFTTKPPAGPVDVCRIRVASWLVPWHLRHDERYEGAMRALDKLAGR